MDIKTDTSPKEIIVFAMTELAEFLKPDGFQFYKSKLEIRKRSDFTFSISIRNALTHFSLHHLKYPM